MQIQNTILEVIARHVECDPAALRAEDVLADIGLDSLKFIMLVLEIEQLVNRKIFNINNIGKLVTVGDILALAEPAASGE